MWTVFIYLFIFLLYWNSLREEAHAWFLGMFLRKRNKYILLWDTKFYLKLLDPCLLQDLETA